MAVTIDNVIYLNPPFTFDEDLSTDAIAVYGDWDDVTSHQFAVHWHENGLHAQVITFSGSDYGGGIDNIYQNICSKSLDVLISEYRDARCESGYYKYDIQDFRKVLESGVLDYDAIQKM